MYTLQDMIELLKTAKSEINNLESDAFIEDGEGFITDDCISFNKVNKVFDNMISEISKMDKKEV